jgi:hypothetical protein
MQPYLSEIEKEPGPHPGSVAAISQMKENMNSTSKPNPLNILASMRSRHSTDPLDKVDALLNVFALSIVKIYGSCHSCCTT